MGEKEDDDQMTSTNVQTIAPASARVPLQSLRALIGFMTLEEARAYLNCKYLGTSLDESRLRQILEPAAEAVAGLSPFAPNAPDILSVPSQFADYLEAVRRSPAFVQHFASSDCDFSIFPIANLVAFQRDLVIDSVHAASRPVSKETNLQLLEYCLPLNWNSEVQVGANFEGRSVSFTSWDRNLELSISVDPTATHFAMFLRPPFVQVAELDGKYFLKNGYHRAYWLAKSGISHVPCILIHCRNLTEVGAARPAFFSASLLQSNRPPLITDFLNPHLAASLERPPSKRVISVSWQEMEISF